MYMQFLQTYHNLLLYYHKQTPCNFQLDPIRLQNVKQTDSSPSCLINVLLAFYHWSNPFKGNHRMYGCVIISNHRTPNTILGTGDGWIHFGAVHLMRPSRMRPPDQRYHHHWWRATDQSHPIQISRVPRHLGLQNSTRHQSLCERRVDEVASGHWSPVRQEDANLPQGESLQVDCAPSGTLQVRVLASDYQAWASSSNNGDEDAEVAAGSHTTRLSHERRR